MRKHTPGPWSVDCNQFGTMPTCHNIVRNCSDGDNGVSDRNGVMVVGVGDCGWDDCDGPSLSIENATLIAAAPVLLEACQRSLAAFESYARWTGAVGAVGIEIDLLRAAIKKAVAT